MVAEMADMARGQEKRMMPALMEEAAEARPWWKVLKRER